MTTYLKPSLIERLKNAQTLEEKIGVLDELPVCKNKIYPNDRFEELIVKSLVVIEQEHMIGGDLAQLMAVEKFYSDLGGIVGYHYQMLTLLGGDNKQENREFYAPDGIDISSSEAVKKEILDGIFHLEEMAEIYPLGGAADRLRSPLPAAKLPFGGKSLLHVFMFDLQAREYLFKKLFFKKITTPLVIMTSKEKDNHHQVLSLFKENNWFGRPQESIRFICQPSVPTMNKEGKWLNVTRPGGHGVIWKLAKDNGIFDWLYSLNRKKALVRQINNPIAGVDHGLLAFMGIGCSRDKAFGFASCPRFVKTAEGMNVLMKKGGRSTLTNIEYTDFKKYGIADEPQKPLSPYSKFPSNTNILFVDLKRVEEALKSCPIPGLIVNLKKSDDHKEEIVRLESTMQNIADCFESADTFLTYNERHKTISTLKKEYVLGSSLIETPEGCLLDLLKNAKELLTVCQMQPSIDFIFFYNPVLGPLYPIIAQKIRRGKIEEYSEMQLDIADLDMENLYLKGSLLITGGSVTLKNVRVENEGIDRDFPNIFWKNEVYRKEVCIIRGKGEFFAENITLRGNQCFEVEEGMRLTIKEENGKLLHLLEKVPAPWTWMYAIDQNKNIFLRKSYE